MTISSLKFFFFFFGISVFVPEKIYNFYLSCRVWILSAVLNCFACKAVSSVFGILKEIWRPLFEESVWKTALQIKTTPSDREESIHACHWWKWCCELKAGESWKVKNSDVHVKVTSGLENFTRFFPDSHITDICWN